MSSTLYSYSCRKIILPILILSIGLSFISCRKLVESNLPKTSLSHGGVYSNDIAAISVLTGLYHKLNEDGLVDGRNGLSLVTGLAADEFQLSNQVLANDVLQYHYIDSLFSNETSSEGVPYWSRFYNFIFNINSAIEGLTDADKLTDAVKFHLLGEAKFLRAFIYFYLYNLYGDVPLALTTDWKVNSQLSRSNKTAVFQQIILDLTESQNLLSEHYLSETLQTYGTSVERVRPTKWAAGSLLSRVYLYNNDWLNAEAQASLVINNSSLFSLVNLKSVFLKNSTEAIWQLQPVRSGQNTSDGTVFILPSSGPSNDYPVYLSTQLLSAFELADQRRYNSNWVDSVIVGSKIFYYPSKYKVGYNTGVTNVHDLNEYLMVLRLGELFLIRAEARAQQGKIPEARSDLNVIRSRAGLSNTSAADKNAILEAIERERQVELFGEWGHRWFDLKRAGHIDDVMTVVRPLKTGAGPWKSYMQLYPVPFNDILKNPNLVQNAGY